MELPLLGNLQSVTFKLLPANSKQQTANSKQQTANSKQQTANSKQQTANSKQQLTTHNPKSEPPTPFSLTKLFDFEVSAVGSAME
jgi:hypothetical protein